MCLSAKEAVAYKPYHNQLRKEEFPIFMRQLAMRAIAQFARQHSTTLPDKLATFDDVLLQDGSSFHIHRDPADVYPSQFKRRLPHDHVLKELFLRRADHQEKYSAANNAIGLAV